MLQVDQLRLFKPSAELGGGPYLVLNCSPSMTEYLCNHGDNKPMNGKFDHPEKFISILPGNMVTRRFCWERALLHRP